MVEEEEEADYLAQVLVETMGRKEESPNCLNYPNLVIELIAS